MSACIFFAVKQSQIISKFDIEYKDLNTDVTKMFRMKRAQNPNCFWSARFKMEYPYSPTPPLGQDMTQGQFLSGV